jgi:carboxylesterase type B
MIRYVSPTLTAYNDTNTNPSKVVKEAGCSGSSDTLSCLRTTPYTKFLQACNSVPGVLGYFTVNLSYLPRPDFKTLTASPEALVAAGKYTKVPFIVGDQEDEGTLFGLFTPNLTTTAEVSEYLSTYFFTDATTSQIDQLVATYPNVIEDGSPFRTGLLNNWYPQFKRISAILGDLTFTLTRRVFLSTASAVYPDVPSWSYLATYDYGTPILGTFHGSDLLQVFYGVLPNNAAKTVRGYYYSFIYNLDPNEGNTFAEWPQWSTSKKLMNFGAQQNTLIDDNFRSDSAQWLANNVASLRV